MPQMMPLNWIIMYTMFIMSLMMFNFMNYYSFNPLSSKKNNNYTMIKQKDWKW
uniref:ATP synthase complex subunit 8 n=1 Tax=Polyphaga plancyi TaxID=1804147 RepID=A0A6M9ATE0_9NEOP|nr:ATP synthase F0 subunit 8 [Polyphaga plancyi]QKK69167.1 ATP synthase F0 subunit 8 [Polyphaga plancyi]